MRLIPNSGELDNVGRPAVEVARRATAKDSYSTGYSAPKRKRRVREKHGEMHSAKAHRCVDKVRAKCHPESNSWAICTASMGKDKVYAKGHGGSATPKRKVREHGSPGDKNYPHRKGSSGSADVVRVDGKDVPYKTLQGYSTPYYYSERHGGPKQHFRLLSQLRTHIRRYDKKHRPSATPPLAPFRR